MSEGAGNAGCWPHPRALRAKKGALCARKQQQGSRNNRHSLRDGLRLIRDLPGVPGLLASVTCRFVTSRLDASIGAPGPRDFARPREAPFVCRRARVHRIPASRFVTIAIRPLCEAGCGQQIIIFRKTKDKYFWRERLTYF